MTPVEIREIGADLLPTYSSIPSSFKVESQLRIELVDGGLGGFRLIEERVEPYMKWGVQSGEDRPETWPERFRSDKRGVFMAFRGSETVGGATVLIDFPAGIITHFEKEGTAVLWDIRIHPDERRRGIGTKLFRFAADWARGRGCHSMKIETQNVNVPACRFYAKNGCVLGAVHRFGYASALEVAHEAMLQWYLEL